MSGEQYALPDAVSAMRAVRKQEMRGDLVSLSAADPLNLTGIITPGARVPALTNNRVLYRDGVPVATLTRRPVGLPGRDGAGQGVGGAPGAAQKDHAAGIGAGGVGGEHLEGGRASVPRPLKSSGYI